MQFLILLMKLRMISSKINILNQQTVNTYQIFNPTQKNKTITKSEVSEFNAIYNRSSLIIKENSRKRTH